MIRLKMDQNPAISVLVILENQLDELELAETWAGCQCLTAPAGDSIAAAINRMAKEATGEILIITSSKVSPSPGWQQALVPHIVRPDIGLVTGKLVYADDRLYSCGLVLGTAGAVGRWHHGCPASVPGYGGWLSLTHEVSAVPWQFMGVKRKFFLDSGMFDSAFVTNGFELDLALRLQTLMNLRHLAVPDARAVLRTDFLENELEKWNLEDLSLLWSRWAHLIRQGDPYLNPNFSLYSEEVHWIDQKENDLRTRGCFMAYDSFTTELLGRRFPGRLD